MVHIIHTSSKPGGIEVLMPVLIKEMNETDFSIFVIRPSAKKQTNVYSGLQNVKITYGSYSNLIVYLKLFFYALRYRDDVFHLYNVGPFILLLLRITGTRKIVYSIRGTKYWKKPWQKVLRKFCWRKGLSRNVKIIANSKFSRSVFLNEITRRYAIDIVYNPVFNSKYYDTFDKKKSEELNIIYAGRLVKGKNLELWLEVAAKILERYPDTKFRIYGDGPMQSELINYAKQLSIDSSVSFMGYIQDVISAQQQADLMIFLSEYESFGNVVVESILCNTPVIVSSIPSMKEIFQKYPEFLVNLDNNLIKNILQKIDKIDSLKEMTTFAREEFMVRFSIKQHIEKLESIYRSPI